MLSFLYPKKCFGLIRAVYQWTCLPTLTLHYSGIATLKQATKASLTNAAHTAHTETLLTGFNLLMNVSALAYNKNKYKRRQERHTITALGEEWNHIGHLNSTRACILPAKGLQSY
ncbi:hypothetical protein ARMGADRAFT_1015121 [Armillaria gallica]|uniref:Uncharacterized protein n=1 Tax=Armillaria gallica TaxID=47427 RepID=A0A2H3D2I9_ARMGA|nr:hypothetical protein ARMGADRAFT_1015121 [Armillaria gallica]